MTFTRVNDPIITNKNDNKASFRYRSLLSLKKTVGTDPDVACGLALVQAVVDSIKDGIHWLMDSRLYSHASMIIFIAMTAPLLTLKNNTKARLFYRLIYIKYS